MNKKEKESSRNSNKQTTKSDKSNSQDQKDRSCKIPKAYGAENEMDMYEVWEDSGYFNPDNIESDMDPFVIILPPPNANGDLHIGHTCGYSFQDCMGRYNRMKGHPTLLLPGKDHAGIQTEAVFTEKLADKGIDKWEIGRDEFYKRCYEFCIEAADNARNQEKRIGLSADWSREKFTLNPKLTEIVYDTFYKLFEDDLVYRGEYIVNQCTNCRTALANMDTEHKKRETIFAYIKYPVIYEEDDDEGDSTQSATDKGSTEDTSVRSQDKANKTGKLKYVTVATTRPETMLGDTAVAVNPEDPRYKDLVGKKVKLPLTDREIPIIAEKEVDKDFGTGCLKVTPAHSAVDFEIGREHDLEVINVIDETGHMNKNAPQKYQGLSVDECRDEVMNDLREKDLLPKVEEIEQEVLVCERCKNVIEQIISKQWFVKVKPLAKKAVKALDNGETKILPDYREKVLRQWFEDIRPWCISRQLWWGHRIPIWYCGSKQLHDWLIDNPDKTVEDYEEETGHKAQGCGEVIPSDEDPGKCPHCQSTHLEAEKDCFDTWFSSGQWTFSTLGGVQSDDFKTFYPGDVMETMWDILFFWVARMMMLGIYRTGKTPFHTVYLHGMILAPDGEKMSKSRGNGVEPAEVFEKYGADALRLWYYSDALPGKNTPIRDEKLEGNRNLVNKIWNASRYVMFQIQDFSDKQIAALDKQVNNRLQNFASSDDQWDQKTYQAAKSITKYLDKYQFNLAIAQIREFFWHTFCDNWIEETKDLISQEEDSEIEYLARLIAILAIQMKLIHPFAPFVTEKIWQILRDLDLLSEQSEILMVAKWPYRE
jgi:valyl-tRNA synthetase